MKAYEIEASRLAVHSAAVSRVHREPSSQLLSGGLSRFKQIQPYLPVSRETWRLLGKAGRAPQPIRVNPRCTVWHNDEVLAWLADPAGFKVEG
ncbi:transcriptional regulator [Paraburkholderia nemoris]|uniref:helix-turn-helix transcriptional regulator n=1 Tax=Paraburkholderia nemoris TaxID=2793076 RepID=UPI0038BE1597